MIDAVPAFIKFTPVPFGTRPAEDVMRPVPSVCKSPILEIDGQMLML
jgi:hypothetical protein